MSDGKISVTSFTAAREAADEIERLRAELAAEREKNEAWMKGATEWQRNTYAVISAERDELRAERDELETSVSELEALADARCAEKEIVEEQLRAAEAERDELHAKFVNTRILLKRVNMEFREVLHLSDRDTPTWREAWDLLDIIDAGLKGDGDGRP